MSYLVAIASGLSITSGFVVFCKNPASY
jgi:hypothetical protein